MSMLPKRILVFGSAGTGKTSICNYLSGEYREVKSDAVGVTFESYTYNEFTYNENSYIITDTVGLNESDNGTVKSSESLKKLIKLLKDSKEGYNLLIHVIKIGRITKEITDNYKLFIETITDNKIPCILVVTWCENIVPMSKWVDENKKHFDKEGLKYERIIASCFGSSEVPVFEEHFRQLRKLSTETTFKAIVEKASPYSQKIYRTESELGRLIAKTWNKFCSFFGFDNLKYKINENLKNLLIRLGFSPEEAIETAESIAQDR